MSNKGNRVLSGSEGKVWINNELLGDLKSIELKITAKFDDVDFAGDNTTYYKYVGWSGEGSIKLQKKYSRGLNLLKNAFKTGIFPDVVIVSSLKDKQTGQSERVQVSDVVFTELSLAKFESKALAEEDLPLKFSDYQVLDTIDK